MKSNYKKLILPYIILIFATLLCVIPFIIIISASLSNGGELMRTGYGILPKGFTLDAYKIIFADPSRLSHAYILTIFTTVVGSLTSTLLTAFMAFPLSRPDYKWRNKISFFIYFPMIFSGGAIPSYILTTQYLHLKDSLAVLILPMLVGPWNIFLLRTYISKVPFSLIEAAKIDGANEFTVFFRVVLPVIKTGLATVLLLISLGYWNDWFICLMYISKDKYVTLQYFLYQVMSNVEAMTKSGAMNMGYIDRSAIPTETVRMAMCVLAAGPMIFVYMFFQKYFVQGIAVGAVKG